MLVHSPRFFLPSGWLFWDNMLSILFILLAPKDVNTARISYNQKSPPGEYITQPGVNTTVSVIWQEAIFDRRTTENWIDCTTQYDCQFTWTSDRCCCCWGGRLGLCKGLIWLLVRPHEFQLYMLRGAVVNYEAIWRIKPPEAWPCSQLRQRLVHALQLSVLKA